MTFYLKSQIKVLATIILGTFLNGANAADMSAAGATSIEKNQCGEIALYSKPPETKSIYHAWVNTIDGKTVSSKSKAFALSPGKHRIKLIENIKDPRFTLRRGEMMNSKIIEINIEAGKKYYVGAKYIRKNRNKLKTGEYWEPTVWKVSQSKCSI